jgi:hypothetical protein
MWWHWNFEGRCGLEMKSWLDVFWREISIFIIVILVSGLSHHVVLDFCENQAFSSVCPCKDGHISEVLPTNDGKGPSLSIRALSWTHFSDRQLQSRPLIITFAISWDSRVDLESVPCFPVTCDMVHNS